MLRVKAWECDQPIIGLCQKDNLCWYRASTSVWTLGNDSRPDPCRIMVDESCESWYIQILGSQIRWTPFYWALGETGCWELLSIAEMLRFPAQNSKKILVWNCEDVVTCRHFCSRMSFAWNLHTSTERSWPNVSSPKSSIWDSWAGLSPPGAIHDIHVLVAYMGMVQRFSQRLESES